MISRIREGYPYRAILHFYIIIMFFNYCISLLHSLYSCGFYLSWPLEWHVVFTTDSTWLWMIVFMIYDMIYTVYYGKHSRPRRVLSRFPIRLLSDGLNSTPLFFSSTRVIEINTPTIISSYWLPFYHCMFGQFNASRKSRHLYESTVQIGILVDKLPCLKDHLTNNLFL